MGYIGAGPTRFNTADELTVTGDAEFNGNATFGDNDKIVFGAGSDLEIYHSGSTSVINENGTGNLALNTNGANIQLTKGFAENLATFNADGAVTLFYDNAPKLDTTSTGVDVTGTVTADGLTVDGSSTLQNVTVDVDGTYGGNYRTIGFSGNTNGSTRIFGTTDDSDNLYIAAGTGRGINFWTGGSSSSRMIIDGNGNVGIGGSPSQRLLVANTSSSAVNIQLQNNTASDLYIGADTTNLVFYNGGSERLRIDSSGRVGIGTAAPEQRLHIDGFLLINNNNEIRFKDSGGNQRTAIAMSSSNDLNIGTSAGGNLKFYNGSSYTERFRIDSSGNAFMKTANSYIAGTTSLGFYGDAASSNGMSIDSSGNLLLNSGNYYLGALAGTDRAYVGWITGNGMSVWNVQNSFIKFGTNNTERMRLDNSGNLLVGATSNSGSGASSGKQVIQFNGAIGNALYLDDTRTASGSDVAIVFGRGATNVGTIQTTLSSTSYNTSSDYRLKTAVTYDWDATTRLKQLRPARFEWIADGDDAVPVDGFLAHEVQDIVPEAITGTKDGMRDEEYEVTPAVLDEDGNEVTPAVMGTRSVPDYQGIDQSKLVPLLVKTIQELEARIAALETA